MDQKKGGKGTKGAQLADGSQGQEADCEYVFRNRVLQLRRDGSWQYRTGIAISLPHLFCSLGREREYTAAELYGYYNTLETLAVKRPRPWTNPVRQAAAAQRWKEKQGAWARLCSLASRWQLQASMALVAQHPASPW